MRATYLTATGTPLVILGSDRAPGRVRVINRPQAELEDRIAAALASGTCSVCEEPGGDELDTAGRCRECQP
jgi:hypothetical protein